MKTVEDVVVHAVCTNRDSFLKKKKFLKRGEDGVFRD